MEDQEVWQSSADSICCQVGRNAVLCTTTLRSMYRLYIDFSAVDTTSW